jgi:hypothetical protein
VAEAVQNVEVDGAEAAAVEFLDGVALDAVNHFVFVAVGAVAAIAVSPGESVETAGAQANDDVV